jgi:hypothetical protein
MILITMQDGAATIKVRGRDGLGTYLVYAAAPEPRVAVGWILIMQMLKGSNKI